MGTITIIKDDKLFKADVNQAKQLLQEIFEIEKPKNKEDEFSERLDRRAASKFLGVSYQTMYNYCKPGGLLEKLEHGSGRKKYFLKSELITAIQKQSK